MHHVFLQALAEAGQRQIAGFGIQQRHAEQQERRRGGGQQHVLDGGFQRALLAVGIAHQAEQRQRINSIPMNSEARWLALASRMPPMAAISTSR